MYLGVKNIIVLNILRLADVFMNFSGYSVYTNVFTANLFNNLIYDDTIPHYEPISVLLIYNTEC